MNGKVIGICLGNDDYDELMKLVETRKAGGATISSVGRDIIVSYLREHKGGV